MEPISMIVLSSIVICLALLQFFYGCMKINTPPSYKRIDTDPPPKYEEIIV
jgi:hypothetical protein